MVRIGGCLGALLAMTVFTHAGEPARNPILFSDVPDMAMIRVGGTYYMSSTTMHMNPGLPIMSSTDLVNWRIVNYAHGTLADVDDLNLANGRNSYGKGSWASSLRQRGDTFYATTFSGTTGQTHIYRTKDLERGPWEAHAFRPALHDHSLFFDDDGRVYMVYGGGRIRILELNEEVTGPLKGGLDAVIIEDASSVAGLPVGLPAEGSQLFKVDGRYYLFNIAWPKGGMRTTIVHRADRITGPYEGRVVLRDRGIAQGGLIDTPEGKWFAYLFQDCGAVGRIPFLVPVEWRDGWPVLGKDGKAPEQLELPERRSGLPELIAADEFERREGEADLPLVWQWNHNPDPANWSLTQRPGFLRIVNGRVDGDVLAARNTLTQRTFGPACSATTRLDTAGMKDGDFAGLLLLQKEYAWVGVRIEGEVRKVVMVAVTGDEPVEVASAPLEGSAVHLRADCDFHDRRDKASFSFSQDGKTWTPLGRPFQMRYTLPHFMGYRFGLFSFAGKAAGGCADFDFFRPAVTD